MAKLLLLAFLFLFNYAYAEPLVVAINKTLKHSDPELTNQIKTALRSTGLDFEFIEMPSERAIQSLEHGDVDIDPYRTARAVESIQGIVQIKPKINSRTYYYYTSRERKELCDVVDSDLISFSVVGILGVRLFDSYVYPKFGDFIKVVDIDQAMNLVALKRYDFGIWEKSVLEQTSSKQVFKRLHTCNSSPIITLDFFSYINQKHEALIPQIEEAYKLYFSNN